MATSAPDQNITLERLGAPNTNGAHLMAKVLIPGSTTRFCVVETKRFTGYDGQIPGEAVVIHKVDSGPEGTPAASRTSPAPLCPREPTTW